MIAVLYSDNHLLVVNKPPGLLTQSSKEDKESLEGLAKQWIKQKFHKKGAVFLHPIHRLDKPTSGIVIFAKTTKALQRLQKALRERKIQKCYLAWVEGYVKEEKGVLEDRLLHGSHRAEIATKKGKIARQSFEILKKEKGNTLLKITLETGRYHQIRIQWAERGHPILGDAKYGSQKKRLKNSIALHHFTCTFTHPVTKEELSFTAPPPKENFAI